MRITNVLFGLLLLLCVACNKSEKETPSGLKYTVAKAGDGVLPKVGEVVVFHYELKDSKDSVWTNTFADPFSPSLEIRDSSFIAKEDGLMQMLRMSSKGDSLLVSMPIGNFYREIVRRHTVPFGIDSTLALTFKISILNIMTKEGFIQFQTDLMTKMKEEQLQKDIATIDAFLAEKSIVAEKTDSGLRYVITKKGAGANGTAGQTAKVNYSGYLLDGQYFDTSVKAVAQEKGVYDARREPYQPYEVTIDQSSVISGWHEALKLMNKGSKATFYIPSTLGYGPQRRSEVIKANSILVFDLEVVDLK